MFSAPPAPQAAPGRRLRVLMALWNGGGNVPPQRALLRQLRRAGHDVHVMTHDSLAEGFTADGAVFHALTTAPQWDSAAPCGPDDEGAFIAQHVSGSAAFAADFLARHDELQPDVSVIDAMLITTLDSALARGLRCVAVNHIAWSPDGFAQGFMRSVAASLPARGRNGSFMGLLEEAPLTLVTSYPEFGTAAAAPHVQFVGPIREPALAEPWPRRFPERPFVLVSLSTSFQQQFGTLRNICTALAPLPLEVLVTTGRGFSPEQLDVSGSLEARAFVPHDRIVADVDLVVTHAGLGTLMFAAGAGVPCLCLPNGRDQDDNAARVTALGLGRALPPDAAPAKIGAAVMGMLDDAALCAACRDFAAGVDRFGDLARAALLVEACAAGA